MPSEQGKISTQEVQASFRSHFAPTMGLYCRTGHWFQKLCPATPIESRSSKRPLTGYFFSPRLGESFRPMNSDVCLQGTVQEHHTPVEHLSHHEFGDSVCSEP